mgnify:CR=1 FL=1
MPFFCRFVGRAAPWQAAPDETTSDALVLDAGRPALLSISFSRSFQTVSMSMDLAKARLITYWDGKFEGESVPVGVYSYTISAFGKDGQVANKTGTFSVLK